MAAVFKRCNALYVFFLRMAGNSCVWLNDNVLILEVSHPTTQFVLIDIDFNENSQTASSCRLTRLSVATLIKQQTLAKIQTTTKHLQRWDKKAAFHLHCFQDYSNSQSLFIS